MQQPEINYLFISDRETAFLSPVHSNADTILSEKELHKIKDHKSDLKGIAILAELDWEGEYLQNFYGLEVAKKARLEEKLYCPIFIFSAFSENFFLTAKGYAFDFYNSPGIYYLSLPDIKNWHGETLTRFSFIDEDIFLDITENFGNQEGAVNTMIHDLKNKLIDLSQFTGDDKNDKIETVVSPFFLQLQPHFTSEVDQIRALQAEFIESVSKGITPDSVSKSINILTGNLQKLIPANYEKGEIKRYFAKWKILFLDDEENVRTLIQKKFYNRGLVCDVVSNEQELRDKLDSDQYNWYTVFICDYRLKKPGSSKCEPKQGYSILKDVFFNSSHYLSLFALSSMDTKILLRYRERYQMNVWTFAKEDVKTDSGFNIFCAKVFEDGEKMLETVCDLPGDDEKKAWNEPDKNKRDKALKDYYRLFRMSENFEDEEKKVGANARDYYIEVMKETKVAHTFEFTAALKGDDEVQKMRKFKNKLTGRRIYLALRLLGKKKPQQLWYLMQKKPVYNESDFKPGKPDVSALFSQNLCFPEDFESHLALLAEEKYWLKHTMKYNIDEASRRAVNEISGIIDDYWDENKGFRALNPQFKKGTINSLESLEEIILLFFKIKDNNKHLLEIKSRIKERILEIKDDTSDYRRHIKEDAENLLDQLAVSGVLKLLERTGLQ